MFDEVGINNKQYVRGDWKSIAVHDDKNIRGFFGDYRYLSNFYDCDVYCDSLRFPSSEHAYMFSKLDKKNTSEEQLKYSHDLIVYMSHAQVKKWGNKIVLRPDWEEVKYDVMASIVFDKFYRNLNLREKLINTGDKYLEELNWWSDVIWGVDYQKGGKNWLGKILMKTRDFWNK